MKLLRKRLTKRAIAYSLIGIFLPSLIVVPIEVNANGNGTKQAEHENGSSGSGIDQMVNPATGNFSYSIPLLDVEGYPLNLSYTAGIGMEQEASWVGLGWSLSPGVLNRNVRGLPDDFKGDLVKREVNFKPDETYSVYFGGHAEFVGFTKKDVGTGVPPAGKNSAPVSFGSGGGIGVSWNSYIGLNVDLSNSQSASIGKQFTGDIGLGITNGTTNGLNITPSIGVGAEKKFKNHSNVTSLKVGFGLPFNSREGLRQLSITKTLTHTYNDNLIKDENGNVTQVLLDPKRKRSGGVSLSSTVPFGTMSSIPYQPYTRNITGFALDYGTGGEGKWVSGKGAIKYSKTRATIDNMEWEDPAYGFLFSEHADDHSLRDFNGETDGTFISNSPRLGFSSSTPDIYTASAAGLSVNFRAHRNDLGKVSDPIVEEGNENYSGGGDVMYGDAIKAGVNVELVTVQTKSGPWIDKNDGLLNFPFFTNQTLENGTQREDIETYYWRAFGEMTRHQNSIYHTSGNQYGKLGGTEAIEPLLGAKQGDNHLYEYRINHDDATLTDFTDNYFRTERQPLNHVFHSLTADETSRYGLNKTIRNYTANNFVFATNSSKGEFLDNNYGLTNYSDISRTSYPTHHMQEFTALDVNGVRYIYDIPVYNTEQHEVSFSVDGDLTQATDLTAHRTAMNTGLVSYDPTSGDNSTANGRGESNRFDRKIVPTHATDYLLSAVVSPDYMDVTGDGLTPDDNGNYTRFNYSKLQNELKWRSPMGENTARYNVNTYAFKSKAEEDNTASYVYGSKEMWYLHSVETKNYIAEFHTVDRYDGYGVQDENGKISSSVKPQALDKIVLYPRQEKIKEAATAQDPVPHVAEPIKTIHFVYDYSLCEGTPNTDATNNLDGGKLTLKEVYTTYGNKTTRSSNRSHKFYYGDVNHTWDDDTDDLNPDYNMVNVDRWGTYQPQDGLTYETTSHPFSEDPTNQEFPYTTQTKSEADYNVAAWNLSTIRMPNGSEIHVDYESDTYGYVQNKVAGQMYPVLGFTENAGDVTYKNSLYEDTPSELTNNLFMVVDLGDEAIVANSQAEAIEDFKDKFIRDFAHLYYKCFLNMGENSDFRMYDYVTGYAELSKANCSVRSSASNGVYDVAYIPLIEMGMKDNDNSARIHPISKAAFQFARTVHRKKMFPSVANPGGGDDLRVFERMVEDVQSMFQGVDHVMMKKNVGRLIQADRSWVRLYSSDELVYGGGHRVKQILIKDNWSDSESTEQSNQYGHEYIYDNYDEQGNLTSSNGVIAWEPLHGGDVSPWRKPMNYEHKRVWANNDHLFMEEPIGEFMFPSPTLIYSKVTRKVIEDPGVVEERIGRSEYEFFTAKEHPVRYEAGEISKFEHKPSPLLQIFNIGTSYEMVASQGFVIQLNDMHGKPKKESHYRYIGDEEKVYQETVMDYSLGENLNEVNEQGQLTDNSNLHGREVDMTIWSRESATTTRTFSVKANIDGSNAGSGILALFSLYGMGTHDKRTYRSATFSKVVQDYAVLESTTTTNENYTLTQTSDYFEEESGMVRVNSSKDKYNNDIWSSNDPAYLAYPQMGYAYKNIGATITEGTHQEYFATDGLIKSLGSQYFFPGDEVYIYDMDADYYYPEKYWVVEGFGDYSGTPSCSTYVFMDRHGANPTLQSGNKHMVKIIRSGKRNMLTQNVHSVAAIGTVPNPIIAVSGSTTFVDDAIAASAQKFSEDWKTIGARENFTPGTGECAYDYQSRCGDFQFNESYNPYIRGTKGNWRPNTTYAYYDARNQNKKETPSQTWIPMRDHGTFEMKPFWEWGSNGYQERDNSSDNPWTLAARLAEYDQNGTPIESFDAKGIASSGLMGYNNTVPKAKVLNSNYLNSAFDGFEDYSYTFDNPHPDGPTSAYNSPDCMNQHFRFPTGGNGNLSESHAHSGKFAYAITKGTSVSLEYKMNDKLEQYGASHDQLKTLFDPTCTQVSGNHSLENLEAIPPFSLPPNEPYRMSFWVKVGDEPYNLTSNSPYHTYDSELDLWVYDCNSSEGGTYVTDIERTPIIDGWQKWDVTFTTPNNAGNINLIFKFENKNADEILYMDDFRLHPIHAHMESYVMDPVNLRLRAVLDVNNYATFYEYDDEGQQTILKKETERGVLTISETRQSTYK